MSEPVQPSAVAELLRRAADDVPRPDLVRSTLAAAHRRQRSQRRRRTVLASALVAAAAVAAVVVPALVPTAPPDRPPASTVDPEAGPRGRLVTAPRAASGATAPDWDPAQFGSLPWAVGQLSRSLVPVDAVPLARRPLDRAVAVTNSYTGDQEVIHALGTDGTWRVVPVDAPLDIAGADDGLTATRRGPLLSSTALSPDGSRVALRGGSSVVVVDLASGASTPFPTPAFPEQVLWEPDGRHLLVGTGKRGWVLDTADGGLAPASYAAGLGYEVTQSFGPDGALFRRGPVRGGVETLEAGPPGLPAVRVDLRQVGSPANLLAGDGEVALSVDDGDGSRLVVLERDGYTTRAVLPLPATEADRLLPRVWLDEDTLLFSVPPRDTGNQPTDLGELFVAWDVATGQLARVAETTNDWRVVSLAAP